MDFNVISQIHIRDEEMQRMVLSLIQFGISKLPEISCKKNMTYSKVQCCIGSTLHRGSLHPSPVYDLVVGNAKRGRMCANITDTKRITHHYYYDIFDQLVQIDSFYEGRLAYTEHLFTVHNSRVGITVDHNGLLSVVCLEKFSNGQIADFVLIHCVYNGDSYEAYNVRVETYQYDDMGLSECQFRVFSPKNGLFINKHYVFSRINGYLVAYSDASDPHKHHEYKINKKRKA